MTVTAFLCFLALPPTGPVATGAAAQARMQADVEAGRPLVVHVVVALCDNEHQGIVPVKPILGNGEDPKNNLYWGALYGVKRFLSRPGGGWLPVAHSGDLPTGVLERIVLQQRIRRQGKKIDAYLVAEAWRGSSIEQATERFLRLAAGQSGQTLSLQNQKIIQAGGRAHLLVYVGHDGLMEFDAPWRPKAEAGAPARSAAVLACMSQQYFKPLLDEAGAHSLCLTSNLMSPEAYILEALVQSWLGGQSSATAREAAAAAFAKYQKCGLKAARRLFVGGE